MMEAIKRDDRWVIKVAIGAAAIGTGVAALLALYKWKCPGNQGKKPAPPSEKPAASLKPTAAAASTSKPTQSATATSTQPASKPAAETSSKPPAQPVSKPAPEPVSRPAVQPTAPPATQAAREPAAKPAAAPPKVPTEATPTKISAEPAKPIESVTKEPASSKPAPTANLSPPATPQSASLKDDNHESLSASATFEKVSAENNSMSQSSITPGSPAHQQGSPAHQPTQKPTRPSSGGPNSAELNCDSSRESLVFGGRAYSMIDSDMSTFDPAISHPAFFGFKFDGSTS